MSGQKFGSPDSGAKPTDNGKNVTYTFRRAYETNRFHQLELIGESELRRQADERGISLPLTTLPDLERLDCAGAFSPIMFEIIDSDGVSGAVFRDEHDFVPWSEYINTSLPPPFNEVRPLYSPWQLLYLHDAIELPTATVPIEWLLDDQRRQSIEPVARRWWEGQLERWHATERSWRDLLLVLIRLQNRYSPLVKGTLTKSTITMIRHPETGEYVDPRVIEGSEDAQVMLSELGIGIDELKAMYERLVLRGWGVDPLHTWHMLIRMAPFSQRTRLRGEARRAQDAYDAAEILRLFHHHLTGELLLAPDDMYDLSDKSWKRRIFGRWPMLRYTRADLAVELRLRQMHPYEVHLAVEGEIELMVCEQLLEGITGIRPNDMGVTMHSFKGVGELRKMPSSVLTHFPRFLVLVADREGEMERDVARLKREGILTDETTFLWDTSFEEANFSDDELLAVIRAAGGSSTQLTLDALTLRRLYDAHRANAGADARGLKTFAIGLAAQPAYGSVVVSTQRLAKAMVDLILADLKERGASAAGRPIVAVLMAILRVT